MMNKINIFITKLNKKFFKNTKNKQICYLIKYDSYLWSWNKSS